MPQVGLSRSDYTGFMVNRTAFAALLLALAAPAWANNAALQDARTLAGGNALATYDGGCSGGSCGAQAPVCEGASCRINRASAGALQNGGLVVAAQGNGPRAAMSAEVPAPNLGEDEKGSKDKPGFFRKIFSGKGLMYGLGGAGIGWLVGGPIGAVIGGLLGAVGGFFLSKMLAK